MDKAILIPLIIWAIFAITIFLKRSLSQTARWLTLVSLLVYGFIFKDDIMPWIHNHNFPYKLILKSTVEYAFISLAMVWPAILMISRYMNDGDSSTVIVRLAIFSAIVCGAFLYFN